MRVVLLALLSWHLFAATSIVSVVPTQSQAVVWVHTDQGGFCTYRGSRGATLGVDVPDLVDNGNTDARAGSIINGQDHYFALGTRKGNDTLASGAAHILGATCGSDAEVTKTFTTMAVPWGNMAPDLVPFNASSFGNMDYPKIDWTNQTKSYVDPVEGVEFFRITKPGMVTAGSNLAQFETTTGPPFQLSGANWASLANVRTNGSSYAVASGTSADKVFIPISSIASVSGWAPNKNVDDMLVKFYCGSASQGGQTFVMQHSSDGGQTVDGTPVTTAACPASAPTILATYPQSTPIPLFSGWGLGSVPPQHNLVSPPSGTVSVASSVVTVQSPSLSNNYFVTEWVAGTPILINGTYYHIASIQSPTQLTITENPGTLTNVAWSGANSGIVLYKSGTGSVSVSLGVDLYTSSVADPGTNGDAGMVNTVPVPGGVSKSADGLSTFSPPLKGYLSIVTDLGSQGSIILWIPNNNDGTPRNETRLLSIGQKSSSSATFHAAGDSFGSPVGVQPVTLSVFDGVDGKSWIALTFDGSHVFRMTYDETVSGCAGYPTYNPYPSSGGYNNSTATVADDCFQYTNLTPSSASPAMDIRSQMTRGYQTGLNSLGQSVGVAHPSFDLGWLTSFSLGVTSAGYFTFNLTNYGEHLSIYAAFDSSTGVLKMIKDMWGSDSDTEARWGGIHGAVLFGGPWRFGAMNDLDDNTGNPSGGVFQSAFDMPISQVNRAGYGSPTSWDSNTSLTGSEAYTCPPNNLLPARYASLNLGGTANCVLVKVTTPPCNATPNSTYIFPDGKTEKTEFPCTTPGFGNADVNRSKLMDMRVGDWMFERRTGALNEKFAAMTIAYNGTNDIDIWMLRWARHNYLLPLLDNGDDKVPAFDARPNGWFLSMAPTFSTSAASIAIDVSAGALAKWLCDNGDRAACHGVIGPGTAVPLFVYGNPCTQPNYRGNYNLPISSMLFTPFLPLGASWPAFAGSSNGVGYGNAQNYGNNSFTFGAANPPFQADFRHLNPFGGNGPETFNSGIGNTRTITAVGGTSKSYLIADGLAAGASDYKRLPLHGFAGHYLHKDISGPSTGNIADMADYSICRVFKANQCFQGSTVGQIYITTPKAVIDPYCRSNQFTWPNPCVMQMAPLAGMVTQVRTDLTNSDGRTTRKLGYSHGMPGLQYQFSNCRTTPDADYLFCLADWLDGVRSEWISYRITPVPPVDTLDRTTTVSYAVPVTGIPSAVSVRARYGYLENGGSLMRCTAYGVECSTEIPSGTPSDPYSFTDEAVTRQPCANGVACTVIIPAISNRVVYYTVDWLDGGGSIVQSSALQMAAIDFTPLTTGSVVGGKLVMGGKVVVH